MSGVATGAAEPPSVSPVLPDVTIYDVARECGLAASTVSRAFSRPGRVRVETAQRVHEVAERLGYRAHPVTTSRLGTRSSLLALAVPDITNPVYFAVMRGAQAAAADAGHGLLIHDTQESARLEREVLDRSSAFVDGVVLAGSRLSDAAVRHLARRTPLVTVNRVVAGVPAAVVDHALGERRALEHLAGLGHRHVTYLAGPEASWVDGTRWRAVLEGCEELGLGVRRLGPFAPTVAGGLAAAELLLETPTTAVVAYNDLVAMGVLRRLAGHGVAVPADVSVVGFDNIFGSDFCDPALTTVAAPLRALAAEAVEQLLAQLGGCPPAPAHPTVLPARLVVRGSTGEVRLPQRSRKRTSPADGTINVSGSAAISSRSTPAGSR